MAGFAIEKVTALPGTLTANTVYLVSSGAPYVEVIVTDNTGATVRRVINESDVNTLITNALAAQSSIQFVNDIPARDALTPNNGDQVWVRDASADPDVNSGGAKYIWDATNTVWIKTAESESLDVVLEWANIQNGPSSTPAQIDQAVADSHTHANKTQLDNISEVGGQLAYNGQTYVCAGATAW